MGGNDADFAAYLTARWPSVVRTLILLGDPRRRAEDLARDALARCYDSWEHVRREDDVDAYVYRTVLECRGRRRGSPAPERAPDPEETADAGRLRRAVEVELDRLAAEPRVVLVLRFVAGLDDAQVADALDVPLDSARQRLSDALIQIDLDALGELDP